MRGGRETTIDRERLRVALVNAIGEIVGLNVSGYDGSEDGAGAVLRKLEAHQKEK